MHFIILCYKAKHKNCVEARIIIWCPAEISNELIIKCYMSGQKECEFQRLSCFEDLCFSEFKVMNLFMRKYYVLCW